MNAYDAIWQVQAQRVRALEAELAQARKAVEAWGWLATQDYCLSSYLGRAEISIGTEATTAEGDTPLAAVLAAMEAGA